MPTYRKRERNLQRTKCSIDRVESEESQKRDDCLGYLLVVEHKKE